MRFTLLALVACGGRTTSPPDEPLRDFVGQVGGHPYVISLPAAMSMRSDDPEMNVYAPDENVLGNPYIEITWTKRGSLGQDKLTYEQEVWGKYGRPRPILLSEQRADSYVYAVDRGGVYDIQAKQYLGDGAFRCAASVDATKRHDPKVVVPFVAKLCLSIRPTR